MLTELELGDADAARRRMEAIAAIAELEATDAVRDLGKALIREGAIPVKAEIDAYHVMGLPGGVAVRMINNVRDEIREGARFGDGSRSSGILESYDVSFARVDRRHYGDYLGFGLWFYRSLLPEVFPCLQLIWPDRAGLFPGQPGFDESLRDVQWVLSAR